MTLGYGGLFRLHDAHGLPLSISLGIAKDKGGNLFASLEAFVADAKAAGWSGETISRTVGEAVRDNYTPAEMADDWDSIRC